MPRLAVILVAASAFLSGCSSKPAACVPVAAAPDKVEATVAPAAPASAPKSEEQSAGEKPDVKQPDAPPKPIDPSVPAGDQETKPAKTAAPPSNKPKDNDKPKEAAVPPKPHVERVAILTPGGPIIVDITLMIDGHPQRESFEKVIDEVVAAADTDHDKRSTWSELIQNEEFLKAHSPYGMAPNMRDRKMWPDQYDRNQDGEIQRDEAAAWLARTAGGNSRPFSVRSSRSSSSVASASSRIWKLLDTDNDGQLSAAELAECPKILLALDDDDDGIVTTDELASLRDQLQGGARMSNTDRAGNPFAALYLEPDFAPDRLVYLLTDLYAPQQNLRPQSFPALADYFKQLDENGDGQFDQDEISHILTMKPMVQLVVDFASPTAGGPGTAALTVVDHIPEINVEALPARDQAILTLGTTRVILFSQDVTGAAPMPQANTAASEVRLMVHDQCDALGELLDVNADGRLGEQEITTGAKTLLAFDANHDGYIQPSEVPYTMIVAVTRGEKADNTSFYRPQSKLRPSASAIAPAWFIRGDFNGDGVISRREFLGSDKQFAGLDADHDGFISAGEATAADSTKADANSK